MDIVQLYVHKLLFIIFLYDVQSFYILISDFVLQVGSNNHLTKFIALLLIEKETSNIIMKSLVSDGLKRHSIFCNAMSRFASSFFFYND